jgi:LPS export ABC transporter protein LptC
MITGLSNENTTNHWLLRYNRFRSWEPNLPKMKHSFANFKSLTRALVSLSMSLVLLSCENKINFIPNSDLLTLPSLSVKDVETVYSDSGRIKLILSAPLIEEYNNKESPYDEFRSGIKVVFYDGKKDPAGTVTAKYAKYTKSINLWELRDSVVVINEGNDKLETEVLYWDETKDLIYSDRFVKITNEDQIVMGTGFESDPRLNKRKIKKVSATIYLKSEE